MVCTRNRAAVHHQEQNKSRSLPQQGKSPIQKDKSPIPRFFKVVFGKDCSDVLYLPPKFVHKVKHLVKQIQIEDVSGKQWSVTLHKDADGSLSFRKGWHKFFVDHDLEEGHFLLFKHIKEGHFIVDIYDRSACEKFKFSFNQVRRSQQNKRPRRDPDTDSLEESLPETGGNLRDNLISDSSTASDTKFQNFQRYQTVANANFNKLQSIPEPMDTEDLCCMVSRDYEHQEYMSFLYDLSKFEMGNITEHADKQEKAIDTNVAISDTGEEQFKDLGTTVAPSCTETVVDHETKGLEARTTVISGRSCSETVEIADWTSSIESGCLGSPISKTVKPTIKKELVESKQETVVFPLHSCDAGQVPSAVRKHRQMLPPVKKVEPDLPCEIGSPAGLSTFTAEVKSHSYLELPVHIPSARGRRESSRVKVILLKDSFGRDWPVLYTDAFRVKALTGNWSAFCIENKIKVGDKCRFQSDNKKGIYRVDVTS